MKMVIFMHAYNMRSGVSVLMMMMVMMMKIIGELSVMGILKTRSDLAVFTGHLRNHYVDIMVIGHC